MSSFPRAEGLLQLQITVYGAPLQRSPDGFAVLQQRELLAVAAQVIQQRETQTSSLRILSSGETFC